MWNPVEAIGEAAYDSYQSLTGGQTQEQQQNQSEDATAKQQAMREQAALDRQQHGIDVQGYDEPAITRHDNWDSWSHERLYGFRDTLKVEDVTTKGKAVEQLGTDLTELFRGMESEARKAAGDGWQGQGAEAALVAARPVEKWGTNFGDAMKLTGLKVQETAVTAERTKTSIQPPPDFSTTRVILGSIANVATAGSYEDAALRQQEREEAAKAARAVAKNVYTPGYESVDGSTPALPPPVNPMNPAATATATNAAYTSGGSGGGPSSYSAGTGSGGHGGYGGAGYGGSGYGGSGYDGSDYGSSSYGGSGNGGGNYNGSGYGDTSPNAPGGGAPYTPGAPGGYGPNTPGADQPRTPAGNDSAWATPQQPPAANISPRPGATPSTGLPGGAGYGAGSGYGAGYGAVAGGAPGAGGRAGSANTLGGGGRSGSGYAPRGSGQAPATSTASASSTSGRPARMPMGAMGAGQNQGEEDEEHERPGWLEEWDDVWLNDMPRTAPPVIE